MVWINFIHTMVYYSETERNELLPCNKLDDLFIKWWKKGTRHILLRDSIHIKYKNEQNWFVMIEVRIVTSGMVSTGKGQKGFFWLLEMFHI